MTFLIINESKKTKKKEKIKQNLENVDLFEFTAKILEKKKKN